MLEVVLAAAGLEETLPPPDPWPGLVTPGLGRDGEDGEDPPRPVDTALWFPAPENRRRARAAGRGERSSLGGAAGASTAPGTRLRVREPGCGPGNPPVPRDTACPSSAP